MSKIRTPEEIIYDLGITDPSEIDLEAIAYDCCAVITPVELNGCDARIIGYKDKAIIQVPTSGNENRIRFSIAHELGHWMNDRGKPAFGCSTKDFTKSWGQLSNPESRANDFASRLLMPEPLFKKRSHGQEITISKAKELAEDFRTSLTSTTIRLIDLGSYPSFVALYENGRRKWFKRNPILPDFVWPVENLQKDSLGIDLTLSGSECKGTVSAEDWVTLKGSDEYVVHESSMCVGEGEILSVIWWKDESQIAKLI